MRNTITKAIFFTLPILIIVLDVVYLVSCEWSTPGLIACWIGAIVASCMFEISKDIKYL
jgi:protein-S-isoprenylcysteine O-methyltransferase Ste14